MKVVIVFSLIFSATTYAKEGDVLKVLEDNVNNNIVFKVNKDLSSSQHCEELVILKGSVDNKKKKTVSIKKVNFEGSGLDISDTPYGDSFTVSKNLNLLKSRTDRDITLHDGNIAYKSQKSKVHNSVATYTEYDRGFKGIFIGKLKTKYTFDAKKNTLDINRNDKNCRYEISSSYSQLLSERDGKGNNSRSISKESNYLQGSHPTKSSSGSTIESKE